MTGGRCDRVVTHGTFSLDGGTWEVDNNVWVVGNDDECIVIDAAHDAEAILRAVSGRRVSAVLLTHAHDDHIDAARDLCAATGAPSYLHPEDRMLWDRVHATAPGHAPGACSFYSEHLGAVFTGDTLFNGGPGATGRSFSDFPTIVDSIRGKLLTLPAGTVVHTGHGDDTTVGAEAPHLADWIARGS